MRGNAFGVAIQFETDGPASTAVARECLPPTWSDGLEGTALVPIQILHTAEDTFEVRRGGSTALTGSRLQILEDLDHMVRAHIATNAPEHIFVHAGTVAHAGRAIVVPGQAFSGKTTLVSELVRAGAVYYSDEYAVIDDAGLVHPYPKPLSIRFLEDGTYKREATNADGLGAIGTTPVAIGLVVITQFSVRAHWEPVTLSRSETVLELMSNTFSALDRPDATLAALGRAAEAATGLKGDRGEAAEVAADLLARIGQLG